MKQPYSISLNGTRYYEEGKCPACSSEVDNGGRLKLQKRKRCFLKCDRCKYSILSQKTRDNVEKRERRYLKKTLGMT